MSAPRTDGVRLAELVASLSYAADLGLGQPMAHCMRQTVIALRLADLADATDAEREATYYVGLMFNAFCHADATEQASWCGDDRGFKSDAFELLGMTTAQTLRSICITTALGSVKNSLLKSPPSRPTPESPTP